MVLKKAILVCAAISSFFLAVLTPVYAFMFIACTPSRGCRGIRDQLQYSRGAYCTSAAGGYSFSQMSALTHGEVCPLACPSGLEPTVPSLECFDGTVLGIDELNCTAPRVVALAGQAVEGAVINAEPRDACARAQYLECSAPRGETAVLMQIDSRKIESTLSRDECLELLEECREVNSAFTYLETTTVEDGIICTFGCHTKAKLDPDELPWGPPPPSTTVYVPSWARTTPAPPPLLPCQTRGPACVTVEGSCNPDDDGDYYRWPICLEGSTQWVQLDGSHRIRFDGVPQTSQGGNWILEVDINPASTSFGIRSGRQPIFSAMPTFGPFTWNMECRRMTGPKTFYLEYETRELILGDCICTDEKDCSGNGKAVGSKETGPNCYCECNEGWGGDRCDEKLCQAPYISDAKTPSCQEGLYISVGGTCTPACEEGYEPTVTAIECLADNTGRFNPRSYSCNMASETYAEMQGALAAAAYLGTTVLPECSDLDCTYRGTPTGKRNAEGLCICRCQDGFQGTSCEAWIGSCVAPKTYEIDNGHPTSSCKEGSLIENICTAQCADGFQPKPATLLCEGENLIPESFQCLPKDVNLQGDWCERSQQLSLAVTIWACVSIALYGMWAQIREMCCSSSTGGDFVAGKTKVEHLEDDQGGGDYLVVRPGGKPIQPLPDGTAEQAIQYSLPENFEQTLERAPKAATIDLLALKNDLHAAAIAEPSTDLQLALPAPEQLSEAPLALADASQSLPLALPLALPDSTLPGALPSEPVNSEDAVFFRSHTGCHLHMEDGRLVAPIAEQCRESTFTIKKFGDSHFPRIVSGSTVFLIDHRGKHVVSRAGELRSEWVNEVWGNENFFTIETYEGGPLSGGDVVYLRSQAAKKHLDVQGVEVQATWNGDIEGDRSLQEFIVELPRKLQLAVVEDRQGAEEAGAIMPAEVYHDWHTSFGHHEDRMNERRRQDEDRRWQLATAGQGEAVADLERRLAETEEARQGAEAALSECLQRGDGESLFVWIPRAKHLLSQVQDGPSSATARLERLVLLGEVRMKQYKVRMDRNASHRAHQDRVLKGQAADWKMTQADLWTHVSSGNIEAVRAGLKAKLLVSSRAADGSRATLLHIAARKAYTEVAQALLEARANPNALDAKDRTPLDLAVCEGLAEPAIEELRELGLLTAQQALAQLAS